jgi:hypothetical protein
MGHTHLWDNATCLEIIFFVMDGACLLRGVVIDRQDQKIQSITFPPGWTLTKKDDDVRVIYDANDKEVVRLLNDRTYTLDPDWTPTVRSDLIKLPLWDEKISIPKRWCKTSLEVCDYIINYQGNVYFMLDFPDLYDTPQTEIPFPSFVEVNNENLPHEKYELVNRTYNIVQFVQNGHSARAYSLGYGAIRLHFGLRDE